MIRVLTVTPLPPETGGADSGGVHTSVVDVYRHLPAGFDAGVLVTNPGPDPGRAGTVFARVHAVPAVPAKGAKLRIALASMPTLGVRRTLRTLALAARFGFSPLRFLFHAGVLRRTVEADDPDVVHVHMVDVPAATALLALEGDRPLVVTVHSFNVLKGEDAASNRRYRGLVAWTLRRLRHAILVSSVVKGEAERTFGFRGGTLIPNGIDPRSVRPVAGDRPEGPIRVLFTGNLIPRKSVDTLVEALGVLRSEGIAFRATILGDGPERAALEAAARDLGIAGDVDFRGRVERSEVYAALVDHDVFVMPSAHEGLSIALLEAMSAGLCVVAGRSPFGAYDPLVEGETGFTFEHRDAGDLAGRLRELAGDAGLLMRMKRAARAEIEARFDIRDNATRVAAVLEAAAGRDRREP